MAIFLYLRCNPCFFILTLHYILHLHVLHGMEVDTIFDVFR